MTDQIGDKPWTDEDLAQLKNLVADGSPIELIAMALGRTEDDIRGIVAKAFALVSHIRGPAESKSHPLLGRA
jgi:hypothetical protein|nr:hypothetical protein DBT46_10140 [Aerococcus mictus]